MPPTHASASSASSGSAIHRDDESRSSSSYCKPPAFNGEEVAYAGWAKTMRSVLTLENIWSVVEAPVPGSKVQRSEIGIDADADNGEDLLSVGSVKAADPVLEIKANRAYTLILLALKTPEMQALVDDVPQGNAHELWSRLERHFTKRTEASKTFLLAEYHGIRMRTGEAACVFIARYKKAAQSLKAVKATIDSVTLRGTFINALDPQKYGLTRRVLNGPSNRNLEFDEICEFVLQEEQQMKFDQQNGSARGGAGSSASSSSAAASANFVRADGGSDGQKDKCYNCGKRGHFSRECRSKRKDGSGPSSAGGSGQTPSTQGGDKRQTCTFCSKKGHSEAECYSKHGKPDRHGASAPSGGSGGSGSRMQSASSLFARVEHAHVAKVIKPSAVTSPSSASTMANRPADRHPRGHNGPDVRGQRTDPSAAPGLAMLAHAAKDNTMAGGSDGPHFIFDSGASESIVKGDVPLIRAVQNHDVRINVANGGVMTSPMEGDLVIRTLADTPLHLRSVLTHSKMSENLLSVSALCRMPEIRGVMFTADKAQVLSTDGDVLLEARMDSGLYVTKDIKLIRGSASAYSASASASAPLSPDRSDPSRPIASDTLIVTQSQKDQQLLAHQRACHMSYGGISRAIANKAVDGLDGFKIHDVELCESCIKGKMHRSAFSKTPSARKAATRVLGRIWSDIQGPMPVPSFGPSHSLYLLVIVDEFSRRTFGFALPRKSDAAAKIMQWMRAAMAYHNLPIVEFHSDGGGEFRGQDLLNFFAELGVTATITPPHTPQHNAIAERMNRTIIEGVRSTLQGAKALLSLWADAALAVIHVRNIMWVRQGTHQTAEQMWSGSKPSVKGLHVWGCDAWSHVPGADRSKLDSKAKLCMFIGYNEDHSGTYRLLDITSHKVFHTRDVTFVEDKFTQSIALWRAELNASDGTLVDDDYSYYDFIDRSRNDAELRIAQIASMADWAPPRASAVPASAPSAPPAPVDVASVGPQQGLSAAPVAHPPSADGSSIRADNNPSVASSSASGSSASAPADQHGSSSAPSEMVPVRSNPRPARENVRPPTRYAMVDWQDVGAFVAQRSGYASGIEPRTIQEALSCPQRDLWISAIRSELKSLNDHGTWVPADLPSDRTAIGSKLVFKIKPGSDGSAARYKVRLVAKGYSQREGVDYNETFAPVLYYTSLRIIFAMVAARDLEFKHMDVDTAFLNATLKETDRIYLTLPPDIDDFVSSAGSTPSADRRTSHGRPVFLLKKDIYGIKQAPADWNEEINKTIIRIGYTRCISDTCVYTKISRNGHVMILALYVDDVFSAHEKVDKAQWAEDQRALMSTYKMKDLGDATLVLGMRITRDRSARTLLVDQETYVDRLLDSMGMTDCIPADTPEVEGIKHSSADTPSATSAPSAGSSSATSAPSARTQLHTEAADMSMEAGELLLARFGSVIGSLSYLAGATRADIAHPTSALSRFLAHPLPKHWAAAMRILRYLKKTKKIGLLYRASADPRIRQIVLGPCFSDADWAGDIDDRRSTSGLVMKINGTAVSWKSKKQTSVAQSSAESEYVSAGEAVKEILWLRQLLKEMHCKQTDGSVLLCDNQAAISIASNDVFHSRTKHIDIRHHFIREHVRSKEIDIRWVSTVDQEADILTKALGKNIFTELRQRVMGSQ